MEQSNGRKKDLRNNIMGNVLNMKEALFYDGTNYVRVYRFNISLVNPSTSSPARAISLNVLGAQENISSFYSGISRNGKEIFGFFTIDAFDNSPSLVQVVASDGINTIALFDDIDLSTIASLDSFITASSHDDGDKTWLSNFYS